MEIKRDFQFLLLPPIAEALQSQLKNTLQNIFMNV